MEEAEKFYIIKGLKENRSIEVQLRSCNNIEELKEKMKLLDIQEKSKSNRKEIIYPKYLVTRIPHHTNQFARRQQYGGWNWRNDQSQYPDAITGTRYNVYFTQFQSPSYHHPSFSLQRLTIYPRSRRLQHRPTVFRPDAPTFYPHKKTIENYTLVQPHRTGELMIIQRIINFKKLKSSWIQDHTSVNIIPKNIISQIKGHYNVEYIKTKIATINGEVKMRRALDWFEVLGCSAVEDISTDYAHLKQALSEQFPVVRNRSELETRFYSSSQKHNQKPSDFKYDFLKIHKILKLEMTEEKLIDHIISRLEPQILDYVEVRNPQTTSNLLQIIDKYEERFLNRNIRGSSWKSRDIQPNENNRFPNRNRQENWRETRGNNRYADNSRPRREFNRFESQGVVDNQKFDGRRRGGQSDNRFHNQGS
ncbi:uncharacterized protein TNCV_3723741 [Trichonephila clavipes]|nr:uncharacterized protein TNCV_3723741 [Trichonephila clavipes]